MSEILRMHNKKPEANRKNSISMKQRTNLSQSTNPSVDRIMFFQRTIGNQAVQGLIKSGNLHSKPKKGREAGKEAGAVRQIQGKQETTIQQKCKECEEVQQKEKEDEEEKVCNACIIQNSLVLGSPGDIYEQEADRVSQEVSNSRIFSMGNIQQEFISKVDVPEFLGILEIRGREISSKDKDGARRLRISADCGGSCQEDRTVSPSLESRILQSKGSGSALPLFIRKSMELQTGYDFSNVRVKTDSEAAGLNKSLGARAFTNGSDIWLGRNESVTDVKLMAHELTHVVQQGAAKRISPKSVSVSGIRSKSKVLGYLQSLVKGTHSDSSVYHSDILQFQRENSPDKIMAMQQQILEKPNSSINHKENSGTLRGCLGGCTPSKNPSPPVLKKRTVSGPIDTDCGGSSWGVQWYLDNPGTTDGFIVQHVSEVYAIKDCSNKPIDVKAHTGGNLDPSWGPFWEAWEVRTGKVYVGTTTSLHNADTFGTSAFGNNTKGSYSIFGKAEYYPGLKLSSNFNVTNNAPAWSLPYTKTNPNLNGGTGSLDHNLTASWNCCPDGKDKKTAVTVV
ncbi:MAG: DUF4157 domain-containing protein [Candidatus Methanoperedens sp.]|nr:DUF4157 domain-containing protein [Candidatus Methanoperedens sp.]